MSDSAFSSPEAGPPGAKAGPPAGIAALVVFLASLCVFTFMTENLLPKVHYPTGDEPYYLQMAHSLIYDHDLELTNDFADRDYWDYYPGELFPRHESITVRPGLWSKHAVGVAVLIAPGYAAAGWRGGALTINLLAALLAANLFLIGWEATGRWQVGLLTWLTLSFSNPLASYAALIFPATPAALLTLYAFRQIHAGRIPGDRWRTLMAAVAIGALPWLNAQLLPISAGLFLYATAGSSPRDWLASLRERRTSWFAFFAPLVVSGAGFLAYYYFLYESFLPNWQDHAGSSGLGGTLVGIIGSFWDQQWGLLIHAPLLLLAFAGLVVMARVARRDLVWLAIICLPYFAVIANYKQWWGEWCPAARYLVPLVPLLALPMAYAAPALRSKLATLLFSLLAAVSFGIMAAFVNVPRLMYNHPVGQSSLLLWIAKQGGPDLTTFVPTFFIEEEIVRSLVLAAIYTAGAALIVWLFARAALRLRK